MRFVQLSGSPLRRSVSCVAAALLTWCSAAQAVTTAVELNGTSTAQNILQAIGSAGPAPSFISYQFDGNPASFTTPVTLTPQLQAFYPSATTTPTFYNTVAQFDPAWGVLTGISATLNVIGLNAGFGTVSPYLTALMKEGQLPTVVLNTSWSLNGLTSPASPLITIAPTTNAGGTNTSTEWVPLTLGSTSAAALNQFVGKGEVTSTLTSSIVYDRGAVGSIKSTNTVNTIAAVYNLTDANGNIKINPNTNQPETGLAVMAADISNSYSFLAHAHAVLADGADKIVLDGSTAAQDIQVRTDGWDDENTQLDFHGRLTDMVCSGECEHFTLEMSSFTDLVASNAITGEFGPTASLGTISFDGAAGQHSALYTLKFNDAASVGATTSQQESFLSFRVDSGGVAVSAVPEPHGAALLLAGLGAMGWLSRRRRQGADQRQVAKL
jgi:hypothetical protein